MLRDVQRVKHSWILSYFLILIIRPKHSLQRGVFPRSTSIEAYGKLQLPCRRQRGSAIQRNTLFKPQRFIPHVIPLCGFSWSVSLCCSMNPSVVVKYISMFEALCRLGLDHIALETLIRTPGYVILMSMHSRLVCPFCATQAVTPETFLVHLESQCKLEIPVRIKVVLSPQESVSEYIVRYEQLLQEMEAWVSRINRIRTLMEKNSFEAQELSHTELSSLGDTLASCSPCTSEISSFLDQDSLSSPRRLWACQVYDSVISTLTRMHQGRIPFNPVHLQESKRLISEIENQQQSHQGSCLKRMRVYSVARTVSGPRWEDN